MGRPVDNNIYVLYRNDILIGKGTKQDIADQMGISKSLLNVRLFNGQNIKRKKKRVTYRLELIEDNENKWVFTFENGEKMIGSITEIYESGKTFYSKNHLRKVCERVG